MYSVNINVRVRPDRNLIVQMLWLSGLFYTASQIFTNFKNYFNYESAIVQRTSEKRKVIYEISYLIKLT